LLEIAELTVVTYYSHLKEEGYTRRPKALMNFHDMKAKTAVCYQRQAASVERNVP
jgi:hypothetical protein